ncbi:MAG: aspartyl protease family protein [Bacteroidetes bacterium]|nr:aspartyl protease family protein [Bacteroidota bacterium]MBI3481817.1 aspartyl protease family protein [Bacteroidota bacterium]
MKRILLLILIVSSANAFAQLGFTLADGATKVQIPIEIHNNLVVVPVIVNNQLPLKFIVDTGVRTTILTQKIFSDILHLAYTKKYTIAGAGGVNLVNAYITNNVTLDLPGVHGRGHAMLVLETDYLELRNSLGSDVHGILGYELFSRFVVKIDYDSKILTLMAPNKFRPSKKYSRLPITVEDTKPYYVAEVKINDTTSISAKLMVDTGASHGLFLDTESNSKIVVPQKSIASVIGRGLGGLITGRTARINSLRIGKYEISDMIANFPDPLSIKDTLRLGKVYRNGSLGGEVLSRFEVVFDFPREKIYLKAKSGFRKKSYFNMSGLIVKADGQRLRDFEITEVRKNSAGYLAGIQPGDKIIAINNYPTSEMDLSELNNYFNTKPGKKIKMHILRGTQSLEKEFRLISEI